MMSFSEFIARIIFLASCDPQAGRSEEHLADKRRVYITRFIVGDACEKRSVPSVGLSLCTHIHVQSDHIRIGQLLTKKPVIHSFRRFDCACQIQTGQRSNFILDGNCETAAKYGNDLINMAYCRRG